MKKLKAVITTIFFAAVLLSAFVICIAKPATPYSLSERRELAKFPSISSESIINGEFMKEFEEYTKDQFPGREFLRKVKATISYKLFGKMDNNGLFVADGHISKIDASYNEEMTDYAADKFLYLYNTYLKDKNTNVYLSIVPDKNYVIAEKNGYPSLDYEEFINKIRKKTDYMKYIDITDLLSQEDYYATDTHWKQENIIDIAQKIATQMGTQLKEDYKVNILDNPFNGVYSGQFALSFPSDEIKYLTNDTLSNAIVKYYDTGVAKEGDMYNMEKAFGKDPYEMFLSGTTPLVTIENPNAKTEKELVIFRDSFGSSLAPLFTEAYKKITVVDIRYVQSSFVGNLVEFENKDVLFIYSTSLLNNSLAMK